MLTASKNYQGTKNTTGSELGSTGLALLSKTARSFWLGVSMDEKYIDFSRELTMGRDVLISLPILSMRIKI